MERSPWFRALVILLVVIAFIYLLGRVWEIAASFSDIILLFFLAWLLAFVLKPVARLLRHRLGVPWPLAVGLVYLGLFVALFLAAVIMVPIVALQLAQLGTNLPKWAEELPSLTTPLQAALLERGIDVNLERWYQNQDLPDQIQQVGTLVIQNTLSLVTGIASAVFAVLVVLILSFYFLLDGDAIADELLALVPSSYRREVKYLLESVECTFGGFLRGQLLQAMIYGIGTALVMYFAGLGYVLLASLVAGVVMFIPFFGPFLALAPPLLVAFFHLPITGVVLVLAALLVLQQVVLNILAPKIMSESVGIHPLLVFLAILAGAKMAGLAGAIFGVPIAGVLNAMLWHFYRQSDAYKSRMSEITATETSPLTRSTSAKNWWLSKPWSMARGVTAAVARAIVKGSQAE